MQFSALNDHFGAHAAFNVNSNVQPPNHPFVAFNIVMAMLNIIDNPYSHEKKIHIAWKNHTLTKSTTKRSP
jgi:hypothetical protein